MQASPNAISDVRDELVIYDMSETIFELIKSANRDEYLPIDAYKIFDEDDHECYGVNLDKHHYVSRECIENYIWLIYSNTQMEEECLIPAVMYLQKLLNSQHASRTSKLRMYSKNWKTIVGMSMLIAAKVWDDFHMDFASAVTFLYCMDLQRCNKLEILCLKMIDFDVSIKRTAFFDYEEDIMRNVSQRISHVDIKKSQDLNDDTDDTVSISVTTLHSPTTRSSFTDNNFECDEKSSCLVLENALESVRAKKKELKLKSVSSWRSVEVRSTNHRSLLNEPIIDDCSTVASPMGFISKISGIVRNLMPFWKTKKYCLRQIEDK
jgi:hypothetical protein